MSKFEPYMGPFDLERLHQNDLGDDCVTIDVEDVDLGPSSALRYLCRQIDDLGKEKPRVFAATKLYIVGDMSSTLSLDEESMGKAMREISALMEVMLNLKELTWFSRLPFMPILWKSLPKSLTKFVVHLGVPIRYHDRAGYYYISQDDMRPLQGLRNLRELRIFNIFNSIQSIIWECVFRNEAREGMQILEIEMFEEPLVRQEQWIKGSAATGLCVFGDDRRMYKGLEGKGVLHHSYGTGEYLDDLCMRKARIASGLDEAIPLPLQCLKLDGFVVDHLPFERELSNVALLTCGEKCIDAGLRVPVTSYATTKNTWIYNGGIDATHCLVAWPNWSATLDNHGRLLDPSGKVVDDSNSDDLGEGSNSRPAVMLNTAERLHRESHAEATE